MTPHFAITPGEFFAISGMVVFFLCCLPRLAFAADGIRLSAPHVASYRVLSSVEVKARIRDRSNSHNPLYRLMDLLVKATGKHPYSYPAALFFISLIVRLALLPWSIRQFRDGRAMRDMEPEVRRLQEECRKDPKKLSAAVSALYAKHGIDPRFAIFFAVAQGAIFLCLYSMVALYQYQFTHGAFLWIGSAFAHTYPKWVGASLAKPDLPLLAFYGLSMCFTPLLISSVNSSNSCMLKANSVASAIFVSGLIWLRHTPSAFVLYWLISNILSLLIQAFIARWVKVGSAHQPNPAR